MTFVETVAPEDADGAVAEIYDAVRAASDGELPNHAIAFSLHPEVYRAWQALNGALKADMDLRRYELATLAAARRIRSSYCALAHGSVLLDQFLGADQLRDTMIDHHAAGLDEVDVAVMDLADKVASDATAVTEADIERLRDLGLPDTEVSGVVLAAAARCFFSKSLDGLGAEPDAKYAALPGPVRDALTVGRPIAEA
jgi:alkylhydroperoxidase family enzyme